LQISRVLYLLVIVGCEMDSYGFGLAFCTYWRAGELEYPNTNFVMRILLCVGPIGFVLSMLIYMYFLGKFQSLQRWLQNQFGSGGSSQVARVGKLNLKAGLQESLIDPESQQKIKTMSEKAVLSHDEFALDMTKEEFELKPYHFLPIVRYYLLVKDPDANDVESLFRVNALSSFTLGFAQIFCMWMGFTNGSLKLDVFTKLGMFAQVVNFLMTILYFFTPYPERMKHSMSLEAFAYNARKTACEELTRFQQASQQMSLKSQGNLDVLSLSQVPSQFPADMCDRDVKLWEEVMIIRSKLVKDIGTFSHTQLDFTLVPIMDLFDMRRRVVQKVINEYGRMADM